LNLPLLLLLIWLAERDKLLGIKWEHRQQMLFCEPKQMDWLEVLVLSAPVSSMRMISLLPNGVVIWILWGGVGGVENKNDRPVVAFN
jgi:hypothetical protein